MTTDPLDGLELDIRADLERVEAGLRDAARSAQPLVREAAGHVLASGGKRFRPMLTLLAGRLGDFASHDKQVIDCAVAIELTHLATLYHDDVMDEASVRRGHASANARFDNRVAILAGDWLFARASAIAADLGTYPSRVLAETIAAVCEGQIMESEHTGTPNQTIERYMETIKRKTAALLATSCHLGAWIAGAPEHVVEAVTRYGEALGIAFQLHDDVLDIVGVQEESGKAPGTDLREGVWTLPVLLTLADEAVADQFRPLLEDRQVERAIAFLQTNDAVNRTVDEARRWSNSACEGLSVCSESDVLALKRLASFVSSRNA